MAESSAQSSGSGAALVSAIILLAVGCVSIGYGLSALVNDLGDAALPFSGGGVCAAMSAILFSRAQTKPAPKAD